MITQPIITSQLDITNDITTNMSYLTQHLNRYKGQIIVIKCGGSIIGQNTKNTLLNEIALLKSLGVLPILIHGGGPDISRMCTKLGINIDFVSGHRITDADTLEVCKMVLLGKINTDIVNGLNSLKIEAIGISGVDGGCLLAKKYTAINLGFVGEITQVNTKLITTLLNSGLLPVITPLAVGEDNTIFNVNADYVACAVASALKAERLFLTTNVDGYYKDINDPYSLMPQLKTSQIEQMYTQGQITGGMYPKLKAASDAVKSGVHMVHILNGNLTNGIIKSLLLQQIAQTIIIEG